MYILIINRIIELRTIIIKKANQMDIDLKLTKKEIIEFFYDSMIKRTIKRQNSNGKLIRNLFEQKLWDRILLFINEYEIIEKIQFYYSII